MNKWDVFICHASEDKETVARPLNNNLIKKGIKVWLDEDVLKLGDSLREKIDLGLSKSNFGIVILSIAFFSKHWSKIELNGLISLEDNKQKKIIPIWHNINKEQILKFSPILADRLAVSTEKGIPFIAGEIIKAIKPSIEDELIDELLKKLRKYIKFPSQYILLYCIIKEGIKSSAEIAPFEYDEENIELYAFPKDYSKIHAKEVFIKYGIGGYFKLGIQKLLDDRILNGAINDFEINEKYENGLNIFLQENKKTFDKMIVLLREDDFNRQFMRQTIPNTVEDLAKEIIF